LRFLKVIREGKLTDANYKAYLYRIAHNWIIDYYRHRTHDCEYFGNELENVADQKNDEMENRLDASAIRNEILQLNPVQQQVLVLRYFEDWTIEEIASFVEKKPGAVKAILHRSLASLRKKISERCKNV